MTEQPNQERTERFGPDTAWHNPTFEEHGRQDYAQRPEQQSGQRTWEEWDPATAGDSLASQPEEAPASTDSASVDANAPIGGPPADQADAALRGVSGGRGAHRGGAGSQTASQVSTDAAFGVTTANQRRPAPTPE